MASTKQGDTAFFFHPWKKHANNVNVKLASPLLAGLSASLTCSLGKSIFLLSGRVYLACILENFWHAKWSENALKWPCTELMVRLPEVFRSWHKLLVLFGRTQRHVQILKQVGRPQNHIKRSVKLLAYKHTDKIISLTLTTFTEVNTWSGLVHFVHVCQPSWTCWAVPLEKYVCVCVKEHFHLATNQTKFPRLIHNLFNSGTKLWTMSWIKFNFPSGW